MNQLNLPFNPWTMSDQPLWWRLMKLRKAADEYAESFIIYRQGEYGESLKRSNVARDEFYYRHEKEAIYAGHQFPEANP